MENLKSDLPQTAEQLIARIDESIAHHERELALLHEVRRATINIFDLNKGGRNGTNKA